ncbi:cysteine desulfurase [Nocardioides albertanoniae]|uniref:Cysteine desulfurase n=1 Tax=Nocardioides albertanoniae TaxID=1175486 RepID=A0A543A9S4_9ACTN|nr:aminotransferase class V-fold PLP-dependent enzyme [Nocardioides albertanoniae]TQL69299.1 cysteine desulfurase [Nocardioides albertanoniae]
MTDAFTYLDAASAEPLHPAARDVLLAAADQGYADPRRLHRPARNAGLLLENAREVVAEALGVRRDEVLFTSSGTAAAQAGLLGLGSRGIAHTAVEHQAVIDAAHWSPRSPVVELGVDDEARVDLEQVRDVVGAGAVDVVAVQQANHEVGTLQPLEEVAAAVRQSGRDVRLFVDAAASMGRLPIPAAAGDVIAGSARKWGGPGGVGVLVVRKRAPWRNPFPGDPWARTDLGFTNTAGALAAAAALQAVVAERDAVNARQHELIDLVRSRVKAEIPDVDVAGPAEERLPHLVTFSALYVDGEALVTALDRRGAGVASGSACTSDTRQPSRVLAAMGALTHGNVRLSLTRDTTREDVERVLDALPGIVKDLRAEAGL